MRGSCARCQEFRSDIGEDAWSIIWKRGNPTCERCGSFVDVSYFVEMKNCKKGIYPDNGRPKKLPEITQDNAARCDCCDVHSFSGISIEREKKQKEEERRIERERSGEKLAEKQTENTRSSCFLSHETYPNFGH